MFLRVSRPSRRRFFRGEKRLQANTEALLGPARGPRPGRIMVTLGVEAADDPYFITRLVQQVPAISQLSSSRRWFSVVVCSQVLTRKYKAARLVINALSEHPDHAINPSLSACAI